MDPNFDELDEELGQAPAAVPIEEELRDRSPLSVIEARQDRAQELGAANLFQGLGDLSSAIASQGRLRVNPDVFNSIRKEADQKVIDAAKDAESQRKLMAAFIKNKADLAKNEAAEEWKRKNFEQRDKAIEATRINKEEARNKPSDANNLSAGYGKRMEQAESVFDSLENSGYNRANVGSALESAASDLPYVGDIAAAAIQSEDSKKQAQAEKNFLSAVLRRESGASISPSERAEGAAQYFPRVGDTAEVKAQKKLNRQQAMESLKASAGPAWDKTPLISPQSGGLTPAEKARLEELRKKRGM